MIYTLLLDTSSERGIVGIALQDQLICHCELPFGLESSKYLMEAINTCFAKLAIGVSDLKAIAVACGPGSFTGIRVGASFAKGIALARRIPLIALSSLESFIHDEEGEFASIIDAKIGSAYLLLQKKEKEAFTPLAQPRLYSLEDLKTLLDKRMPLVTPTPGKLKEHLQEYNWKEKSPCPRRFASLAEESYAKKAFSLKGECQLNYLNAGAYALKQ